MIVAATRAISEVRRVRSPMYGHSGFRSSRESAYSARRMARKRDIKEFDQACREVGLTDDEQYKAGEDFHAEKEASGSKEHRLFGELVAWLREWKEDRWQQ